MRSSHWPFGSMKVEMNRLQQEMDRLFGKTGFDWAVTHYPPVNVWGDADNVYVEAELPGVNPADVDLELTGEQQLVLKGKRVSTDSESATWHRRERGAGEFERSLELPFAVNSNAVTAKFQNGVLFIKLPKSEEQKAHKIVIQSS